MRFAAAHGLFQVKNGLRGHPCEPGDALGDEVLHALGDFGLLEKLCPLALGVDQLVKLFDLVAELDGQGIGV